MRPDTSTTILVDIGYCLEIERLYDISLTRLLIGLRNHFGRRVQIELFIQGDIPSRSGRRVVRTASSIEAVMSPIGDNAVVAMAVRASTLLTVRERLILVSGEPSLISVLIAARESHTRTIVIAPSYAIPTWFFASADQHLEPWEVAPDLHDRGQDNGISADTSGGLRATVRNMKFRLNPLFVAVLLWLVYLQIWVIFMPPEDAASKDAHEMSVLALIVVIVTLIPPVRLFSVMVFFKLFAYLIPITLASILWKQDDGGSRMLASLLAVISIIALTTMAPWPTRRARLTVAAVATFSVAVAIGIVTTVSLPAPSTFHRGAIAIQADRPNDVDTFVTQTFDPSITCGQSQQIQVYVSLKDGIRQDVAIAISMRDGKDSPHNLQTTLRPRPNSDPQPADIPNLMPLQVAGEGPDSAMAEMTLTDSASFRSAGSCWLPSPRIDSTPVEPVASKGHILQSVPEINVSSASFGLEIDKTSSSPPVDTNGSWDCHPESAQGSCYLLAAVNRTDRSMWLGFGLLLAGAIFSLAFQLAYSAWELGLPREGEVHAT